MAKASINLDAQGVFLSGGAAALVSKTVPLQLIPAAVKCLADDEKLVVAYLLAKERYEYLSGARPDAHKPRSCPCCALFFRSQKAALQHLNGPGDCRERLILQHLDPKSFFYCRTCRDPDCSRREFATPRHPFLDKYTRNAHEKLACGSRDAEFARRGAEARATDEALWGEEGGSGSDRLVVDAAVLAAAARGMSGIIAVRDLTPYGVRVRPPRGAHCLPLLGDEGRSGHPPRRARH